MKRILILSLAAGMLSIGTPALMAQVSTNSTPGQTVAPKPDAKQRQEDRRKMYKILDLSPKDLKGLSPADRKAKIKEATTQKISQLQAKKADGTITTDEQADLTFLQTHQRHGKGKAKTDS